VFFYKEVAPNGAEYLSWIIVRGVRNNLKEKTTILQKISFDVKSTLNRKIMRWTIVILLILLTVKVNGQPKQLDTAKDGFWFKWVRDKAGKMKLPDLIASKDTFHIRLWSEGGVVLDCVDLFVKPDSDLLATISFYTEENVPKSEQPTYRTFSKTVYLTHEMALQIYRLLKTDSIINMPSEEKISGWTQGFDGNDYLVEYSTPNSYSCRSYWTPVAQKDVRQAKLILDFFDNLNQIHGSRQIAIKFDNEIPFESYSAGGMFASIRLKETARQGRQYRQERDKYRKSQHAN